MNDAAGAAVCPPVHVPPHVFEGPRGHYLVRPARPDDEAGLRRMFEAAPGDDVRRRFFRHVRRFSHDLVGPLTRMDECCNFAFVVVKNVPGLPTVGSAMLVANRARSSAEFALFVARSEANQRLGTHLLDCLIREARGHRIGEIYGLILADNADMLDLARRLGFRVACDRDEPGCMRAVLRLDAPAAATQ